MAVNDAVMMRMLAQHYLTGENSFPQDQTKEMVLVVVWRIIMTWVEFMREKEIIGRPSSTLRPRLWHGIKDQEPPLEDWSFYWQNTNNPNEL